MKQGGSRTYRIAHGLCVVAACAAGLSSAQAAVVSGRLTEQSSHRTVKGATIEIVELRRSVVTRCATRKGRKTDRFSASSTAPRIKRA
jgi:hypothetical protein